MSRGAPQAEGVRFSISLGNKDAKGTTRYKAFRAAQLDALKRARATNGRGKPFLGAHPFYWAGIIYVGDPGDLPRLEHENGVTMKRFILVFVIVLMTCASGGANTGSAQEVKAGTKASASGTASKKGAAPAIALTVQAGALVRYARGNESAVAMLAAVQMLRRVHIRKDPDRFAATESESGEGPTQTTGSEVAPTFDARKLLSEAKSWVKGDKHLEALIETELKKSASRAGTLGTSVGGPSYAEFKIRGGETHRFNVTFQRDKVAGVAVMRMDRGDLELSVYDENRGLIGSDAGETCEVTWTPPWTGPVTIVVKNPNRTSTAYILAVTP